MNYTITVTMAFIQNIICNYKLLVTIVNNTDWIILLLLLEYFVSIGLSCSEKATTTINNA